LQNLKLLALSKKMYDLAIIGAGAGGIACAKQAVKAGLKTTLIEKERGAFGGICLNKGCIPTKLFLNAAKQKKSWEEIYAEKNILIEKIKRPLFGHLEKSGVDVKWGNAAFIDNHTLRISDETILAKNIIIATGSSPRKIIENSKAVFAEDMFSLPILPRKFLILGGGYIGIEFASLLNALGKEVLVVEKEDCILPMLDYHLSNRLRIILETKGIKIQTGKTISDCNLDEFEMIILAAGREANTAGLDIEKVSIETEKNGCIKTDKTLRTKSDNIYACGDVTGKMLAYIAEYQAEICLENISGKNTEENLFGIPSCAFSLPQVAKVGILETEAKEQNIKYRIIRSNFMKFSSAHVYNDSDGFMEILVDENNKILGAGIISNTACELISIFSLALRNGLTVKDMKKCLFVHPTMSEIIPLLLKES